MLRKIMGLFWLGVFLLPACSGGNALPQASIPPPANSCSSGSSTSCLTVSAPDASGFVTITASAGAVPDSSTVEVRVSSSVSRLLKMLDAFSSPVSAATCASSLPECSADGSTEDCSLTSNDDGSFLVRIQASLNDTVSVVYLDPDTCGTSEAYESVVSHDFVPLSLEAYTLGYDYKTDTGVVFGVNETTSQNQISSFTESSGVVTVDTAVDVDISGTPVSLAVIPNSSGMFFLTDAAAGFLPDGGSILEVMEEASSVIDVPSSQEVQFGFNYPVSGADFTIANGMDCLSPSTYAGSTIDRLFFPSTSNILSVEAFSPFFVYDPVHDTSLKIADYDFNSSTSILKDLDMESVEKIYISSTGKEGYFVALFSDGFYYLIPIPMDNGFCNAIVSDATQFSPIQLPSGFGKPGEALWFGDLGLSGLAGSDPLAENLLLIPDTQNDSIVVVDLKEDNPPVTVSLSSEAALTGASKVVALNVPYKFSLGFVALNNSFMLPSFEIDSAFALSVVTYDIAVGLNPIDIDIVSPIDWRSDSLVLSTLADDFASSAHLFVISTGLSGDGFSTLRVVPLSDIL